MKITYQSETYSPELVTGRYVHCYGSKRKGYTFIVYETISGLPRSTFAGEPGFGPTIRQYETDGSEIPEEIKATAMREKYTTKWD